MTTLAPATTDRYTIISADCHAGGIHDEYREYLDPDCQRRVRRMARQYKNPFRDLQGDGRTRNWDDARRVADLEADGLVAEVIFPNTVPPFFPTGIVIAPAADERRVRAAVGRHPGPQPLARRLLRRAHPTVAPAWRRSSSTTSTTRCDIRWAKEHGLRGVVLPERPARHSHLDAALRPRVRPDLGGVPGDSTCR